MKITTVLMLASMTFAYGKGSAQKLTLDLRGVKLEDAFREISKKTNLKFLYNDELINHHDLVSIKVENANLDETLTKLLNKNRLTFKVVDGIILINAKERDPEGQSAAYISFQEPVQGTVRNDNGEPLGGASVTIKGKSSGVTTDKDGRFTLKASDKDILIIRFVGYKTIELPIDGRKKIDVKLTAQDQTLQEVEVVATGYQTIDRRKFTGAATKVKAEDAQRAGVPDVSRMLEGQVAGVSVQNVSGSFGAAPKIRVRGATSITGDNKPLWVVDGVVLEDAVNISNDQLSTGDISTLQGSSVAGINPDDIASFEILKDAAATALYGARAMNGVIVVTTKKGKSGPSVVNYTGNFTTYLKPTYREFDIMNSYDQMSILAELERKGLIDYAMFRTLPNSGPYGKLSEALVTWQNDRPLVENTVEGRRNFLNKYVYTNTDWFDVLFKNSFMHDHSINIAGGGDKSTFYFSTSYLRDNGWTVADNASRYTFNARGEFKVNDKLSFGLLGNGTIRDQRAPGTLNQSSDNVNGLVSREFDINPFSYAMNTSRIVRPYDDEGNREYITMNYAPFNILTELENNYIDLKMLDLKVQGELHYKFPFNIKYDFLGSYRYMNSLSEHRIYDNANLSEAYRAGTAFGVRGENSTIAASNRFLYTDPNDPDGLPVSVLPYGGLYMKNTNTLKSYYFRNSLGWQKDMNGHFLSLYGGQELRYLDRLTDDFRGYGMQYDKGGIPYIDPRAIKREVEGSQNYFSMVPFYDRYVAVLGTANYSYQSRYQIGLTGRYDGSNQLGSSANSRWLPTWNISGSWNLDQEKFMKNQNFFNTLTLRGTYGMTASMGAAKNSSLVLNSTTTKRFGAINQEPSLLVNYLPNEDLTWEKQYETNIGIEATFLERKYNVVIDLYNRNGFDLISGFYTSGIDGESWKFANHADMNSKGIELLFKANLLKNENFSWTTQLTNAFNKSKITRMINLPNIWSLVTATGGAKEGFPQRGLFSIDFQKLNELNGTPLFMSEKGQISNDVYLQSTVTDYLKYEGPVDPTFNGGFFNTFKYKNFNLGVLITYSAGNKVRLTPRYAVSYSDLNAYSNDFIERFVLPYETLAPSIPDARVKNSIPGVTYNAYNYSSARVADGGFIRMKQITFGYNLPKSLAERMGFKNLTLNAVSNNPFIIYADKKLNGQDPEFYGSGGVALPIPKQYTLSIKATL